MDNSPLNWTVEVFVSVSQIASIYKDFDFTVSQVTVVTFLFVFYSHSCPIHGPLNHYKIPLNHYKIPLNHSKIPLNHDKIPLNHDKIPLNHSKIPLNHDKIPLNHDKIPLNHSKIPLNHDKIPLNSITRGHFPCSSRWTRRGKFPEP